MKDLQPPFYANIRNTQILITASKANPVEIEKIKSIPFRGTSLTREIYIKNAPY